MGAVYKAKQISVDRVVAVKVLLDSLAQNKEFIKRFEREAKIAAKLSHNNVVNAIDAGEASGRFFFVMEYVEGLTIKDYLDKNKMFDEKEAIRIVLAVAEALKHAGHRGLIHRDIKPENVILTKDGGVKLADLGLARLTDDEKWGLAEAGMAIGTPYYISPEQVRGQTDIDIRADIYSLGATFYHMVTGRVPYGGDNPSEVMRKHVDPRVQLVPPDHLNTRLSSGLGMVIETMLAKNREHRYSTPDDLILDLKCLFQGESPMIAAQKPESLEGARSRRRRHRRGRLCGTKRGANDRARRDRQQPQSDHRDHRHAAGCLSHHQSDPLDDPLKSPRRKPDLPPDQSVLAEVKRADRLFPERIIHELAMAGRAKIEPEALVERRGELVGAECLVTLKYLRDCFHRIILEIIFLDFGRVKTGISFNLHHEPTICARGQVLAAEIAREVDHQRFIPQN